MHLDVRLMKVFASGEVGGRVVHGEMKCHFISNFRSDAVMVNSLLLIRLLLVTAITQAGKSNHFLLFVFCP